MKRNVGGYIPTVSRFMKDINTSIKGRRVLVTGASGFLGVALCQRLILAGAEIHAVSRRHHRSSDAMRWWQSDLQELDATRELLGNVTPDIIVHLSGAITGAPQLELVPDTFRSVLTSTVNILQVVTEQNIPRFLYVGSSDEPQGNADEIVPSSPYGAAKSTAGMYCRMFHSLYSTPVVMLRLCMTYGPRLPEHRLISYTIRSFLNGESPKLASGRRQLDLVYLDDVIEGFIRAMVLPNLEGRCADIGSGHTVSVRDIVLSIARLMQTSIQPDWGEIEDRPSDFTSRRADLQIAETLLGWKPTTTLEAGLTQTIEWFRKQTPVQGGIV